MWRKDLWKQTMWLQRSTAPTGSSECVLLQRNPTRKNGDGGAKRQVSNGIDPDELDKPGLSPVIELEAGGMAIRS